MFAFVAKVAMQRPSYKFRATNEDGAMDNIVSDVSRDFFEHSWDTQDPAQIQFLLDAWSAAGSGAVIRYEGIRQTVFEEDDFDELDLSTGVVSGVTTKTVRSDIECFSRRVRLTDFLIADWYLPAYALQEQPHIAEVTSMSRDRFLKEFGNFTHADLVPANVSNIRAQWGQSFFASQWDNSADDDQIFVLRFYEKDRGKTRYRVIANGIMLVATLIPRKDRNYPYAAGVFKPFADTSFFYGKALPDDIAHDQDIYNALKNMTVDRAILHIQRPMITDSVNEIEDDILAPNKILHVAGQVQTLNFEPPTRDDMSVLEYVRNAADRQTSDAQQSGQSGSGVTAREIVVSDENARKIAGVPRMFLEDFDLQGAKLRVGSIMQFFFEPVKLSEIIKDGKREKLTAQFKRITRDKQRLQSGAVGTKIIQVVGSKEDVVRQRIKDSADVLMAMQDNIELDKIVVNSQYIRNFHIDLTIIPNSSFEQSKSLEKALELEYLQSLRSLFPEYFMQNQAALVKGLNEVFDRDAGEFDNKPPQQNAQMGEQDVGRGSENRIPIPISDQLTAADNKSLGAMTGAST